MVWYSTAWYGLVVGRLGRPPWPWTEHRRDIALLQRRRRRHSHMIGICHQYVSLHLMASWGISANECAWFLMALSNIHKSQDKKVYVSSCLWVCKQPKMQSIHWSAAICRPTDLLEIARTAITCLGPPLVGPSPRLSHAGESCQSLKSPLLREKREKIFVKKAF